MSTSSFSVDLDAVAGAAGSLSQTAVVSAFNAAEFNQFDVVKTIKYNFNRLKGMGLITPEEQEQLGKLADVLGSNNDVSSLAENIQRKRDASPVAIALAGITAASQSTSDPSRAAVALSGALVGTLVMFGSHEIFPDNGDDAVSRKALVCILAAVGASAAHVTDALVDARAGS